MRRRTGRGGALAGAGLLALALTLGAGTGNAAAAPHGNDRTRPDRVLIIAVPGLTWEDINRNDVPNLRRLFDDSAVADLATRTISRRTDVAAGYATLGAGTRAIGGGRIVDGQAFETDEVFEASEAGDVFARRTGDDPGDGLVHLGLPEIVDANASERYDAEVGALGDALAGAGYDRAVIANADGLDLRDRPGYYRRDAVAGLMDSTGTVPNGHTGPELLVEDPTAPFGLRYDNRAVAAAFRAVWEPRSVVLVEASDLVRQDAYRPFATSAERPPLFREALRRTDDLVGRLLAEVDLERDLVLVVGTSHPLGEVRLTVLALHEPGGEPGYLRSPSTQRDGFVSLVDVAPTVLDRLGVDTPDSMEGRPARDARGGGTGFDRRQTLEEWDAETTFRDHNVGPVATAFVVTAAVLALATVGCLTRARLRRLRPLVSGGALVTLAYFPAVYLAGPVPFHDAGTAVFLAAVAGGACVLATLAWGAARLLPATSRPDRMLDAVTITLAGLVALLLLDVLAGAPLQFNSPLGYSPKVAGRFIGLGNLGFAALASAVLLLAGLLAHRIGGRAGGRVASGLLTVVFLVAATPFWGSDVGATLALLPAAGITATLLLGARVRVATAMKFALAAVAALALFAAVDLARAPDDRTHLGRLVERIGEDGFSSVGDVVIRRGDQSFTLGGSVWVWMFPIAIGLAVLVLWQAPDVIRRLYERVPQLRASTIGLVVVATLGFVVNDSGIAVPGVMLGVFTSTMMALLTRPSDRAVVPAGPERAPELVGSAR